MREIGEPEGVVRVPGAPLVGVLGGMGPAATCDFYRKLIEVTPAIRDQDHLPVVIWSDPRVPDRTDALLEGGIDPTPWIEHGFRHLCRLGCTIVAMPCNTAHAFVGRLSDEFDVEFIDMIAETVSVVLRSDANAEAVGLLATTGTIRAGLYATAFEAEGARVLVPGPSEQAAVMSVVDAVKKGTHGSVESGTLVSVIRSLRSQGAGPVVLGCTELPLAMEGDEAGVFDPTRILAEAVVARVLPHQSGHSSHT